MSSTLAGLNLKGRSVIKFLIFPLFALSIVNQAVASGTFPLSYGWREDGRLAVTVKYPLPALNKVLSSELSAHDDWYVKPINPKKPIVTLSDGRLRISNLKIKVLGADVAYPTAILRPLNLGRNLLGLQLESFNAGATDLVKGWGVLFGVLKINGKLKNENQKLAEAFEIATEKIKYILGNAMGLEFENLGPSKVLNLGRIVKTAYDPRNRIIKMSLADGFIGNMAPVMQFSRISLQGETIMVSLVSMATAEQLEAKSFTLALHSDLLNELMGRILVSQYHSTIAQPYIDISQVDTEARSVSFRAMINIGPAIPYLKYKGCNIWPTVTLIMTPTKMSNNRIALDNISVKVGNVWVEQPVFDYLPSWLVSLYLFRRDMVGLAYKSMINNKTLSNYAKIERTGRKSLLVTLKPDPNGLPFFNLARLMRFNIQNNVLYLQYKLHR